MFEMFTLQRSKSLQAFADQVDVDPHEVWLSPTTKKLLIRLEDNSRNFLEDLKVDKEAMTAIDTGDAVRGVIVTTKVF